MTTTTNLGLPIYGASDVPKWDDTNTPFQNIDNKVAIKDKVTDFTNSVGVTQHGLFLNSSYDKNTTSETVEWGDAYLQFQDVNKDRVGFATTLHNTDGTTDVMLQADNGVIKLNGVCPTPRALYSHTSSNETWGQLIQLVASQMSNYQNILGRLVVNLGGGQYRWQSGARWCMFEEQSNGAVLSFFTINMTNYTLHQHYFNTATGTLQFNDLTNAITDQSVTLYQI